MPDSKSSFPTRCFGFASNC